MWWILSSALAGPQDAVLSLGGGTGFFVAPDQVLTAAHVADAFGTQGAGVAHWGDAPEPVALTLVAVDRARDLALYDAVGTWPSLALAERSQVEAIRLVGHPPGRPSEVLSGQVVRIGVLWGGPALIHDAHTEWGESGAPLLNALDQVVGMHLAYDAGTFERLALPVEQIRAFLAGKSAPER